MAWKAGPVKRLHGALGKKKRVGYVKYNWLITTLLVLVLFRHFSKKKNLQANFKMQMTVFFKACTQGSDLD